MDLVPAMAADAAGKLLTLALPELDALNPMVVDLRLSPLPPATELLPAADAPAPPAPPLNRLAAPVTNSLIMELYISESAW